MAIRFARPDVTSWLHATGSRALLIAVGDPAADVMVAWKMFDAEVRRKFRAEIQVDDATWSRARGWALSQAVMILSYYTLETNAVLVTEAERWLSELLADPV